MSASRVEKAELVNVFAHRPSDSEVNYEAFLFLAVCKDPDPVHYCVWLCRDNLHVGPTFLQRASKLLLASLGTRESRLESREFGHINN